MLISIAAGATAGLTVVALACYLQRRAAEKRAYEDAERAFANCDQLVEGGICIWNREDPIHGTRVRVAPKRQ